MSNQNQTQLEGKKAIVTGGTRGIGRAVVEALVDAGVAVVFTGTTEESVAEALKELTLPGLQLFGKAVDVSREEDVEALYAFSDGCLGGLDILVNNAGIGMFQPAGEMSLADWKRILDVNLTGAFHCSRLAIPRMKANGGGYIVQMSSLAAKNPFAGGAAYNASKFGMNGMAEAMMLDHRYDNIRVTSVMPGSVDTGFGRKEKMKDSANWKIDPVDVADMVLAALRMPERTLVSRIEIRPTRPPKK